MVDDESMDNKERASQLAVAVGMLLFASVVLGSGVLGDAGEDRLSDENDRGEDADSNPATDREEMAADGRELDSAGMSWEDCMQGEMPRQPLNDDHLNMANIPTDRPDAPVTDEMSEEDRERLAATGVVNIRTDANSEPCMGMFRGEAPAMMGMNSMFSPNQDLRSMFFGMCQNWVHSEFWGNIDNLERGEDGSVSITTYADDGTSSTDTLSAESVRAMNAALAPIVDGCTAMMGSMMMSSGMAGGPHHGVDMHHDWRDCEEEYWDEEYENEPRTRDSAETDRRNLDRDRCEGHEWDEEWDEHDLEEENENFFWEENWDEEARIYTEHWANSDGEFWLTENYANCWGALEWQDPEGNEIVEEWELDDCGDSEESDGDDWVDDDESEEETETHPCNSPDAENCED